VTLDTVVTDDLRLEGLVRNVSRKVNDLRKQAGLALDDRIRLLVEADGDLRRAIETHRDHLMARCWPPGSASVGPSSQRVVGEIGGEPCWLGVSR